MRILAIRGARLASLEATFEVDLDADPLRSAGVFAITGPTGAGKSSLLDALCLALFGNTPRLARTIGQRLPVPGDADAEVLSTDDPRTLVRQGASDAYAEVDFVGVDGRKYRSRWEVVRSRRQGKRRGALRTAQLSLLDVASGQLFAGGKREVLAVISEKLGLGFAQLTRSVILPQNEFAAFLEAGSDERAVLLERATGAEIFGEVAKVTHERAAAARRERELQEARRGALAMLSRDELESLEARQSAELLVALRAERDLADRLLRRERLEARRAAAEEEAQAIESERAIERQLALVETARADVARLDRLGALAPMLAADAHAQAEVERCARALEAARRFEVEARSASDWAREEDERARNEEACARAAVADAKVRLVAARELDARARVDATALSAARAVHAAASTSVEAAMRAAARLTGERERAERARIEAEKALADGVQFEGHFDRLRMVAAGLVRAEGELQRVTRALARADQARTDLDVRDRELASASSAHASERASAERAVSEHAAELANDGQALERFARWRELLTRAAETAERVRAAEHEARVEGEMERAESERAARAEGTADQCSARAETTEALLREAGRAHERVLTALSLDAHRARLVDGEPCPLCGATEHPSAAAPGMSAIEEDARARVIELTNDLAAMRAVLADETAKARSHRDAARAAEARLERWAGDALRATSELTRSVDEVRVTAGERDPLEGRIAEWAERVRRAPTASEPAEALLLGGEVQARVHSSERARRALETSRLALAQLESRGAALDARIAESASRRGPIEAACEEHRQAQASFELEIAAARDELARVGLGGSGDEARRALEARAELLAVARARRDASSQEIERCASELAALDETLPRLRSRVDAAAQEMATIEPRITAAAREIERLVGAAGADALSRTLDDALSLATRRAVSTREEAVRNEERHARLAREVEVASARLEAAREAARAHAGALDAALSERGADRATAARVLGPDRDSIARQRADIARLDGERAAARARTEERAGRRAALDLELGDEDGDTGEALDAAITTARARLEEARSAQARTLGALERDRSVRSEAAACELELVAARAEDERWRALSEVIGAADGKRFRVYAQGLTLDRLLVYANAQLRELAPRYSLVRALDAAGRAGTSARVDSLALAVLDREVPDTLRGVRSLSGGETFLVSLALALGLSDMTSERAPLGSLFLDEGFGSLDPESLELVLSALDTLRSSGRQVAIVTHVPSVAERFAARVEVVPARGGTSQVHVVAA